MAVSRDGSAAFEMSEAAGRLVDNTGPANSRVERNCRPNTHTASYGWTGEEADKCNIVRSDPWWNEPTDDWSPAGIDDMLKGIGHALSDTYSPYITDGHYRGCHNFPSTDSQ